MKNYRPPEKCKKGGATFRTGCDDDGFPIKDKIKNKQNNPKIIENDHWRAKTKVPRHDYKVSQRKLYYFKSKFDGENILDST